MPEATNEVILERVNNLIKDNKEEHGLLIAQTTKTNGRVTDLERWQNRIIGGMITINIFIVPIILWLVIEQLRK